MNCHRATKRRMGMRSLVAVIAATAALVVALVLPVGAGASTAKISFGDLEYIAAAGETNDLTVSGDGANLILDDPGAPITPLVGCAAVNANRVSCPLAGVTGRIDISLGNMNDQALLTASVPKVPGDSEVRADDGNDVITSFSENRLRSYGGVGNDSLSGGPAGDDLYGQDGNDAITGNDGNDGLDPGLGDDTAGGGAGSDELQSANLPDGADVFAGGPGADSVIYRSRLGSLAVTLDGVADDGESGEGDNIGADVEGISGGRGADALTGNDSDNDITGGPGDDAIIGAGGADDLNGDEGVDTVSGGPGDDDVEGDDGADSIAGDGGNDTVSFEFRDGDVDQVSGGPGLDTYRDGSILGLTIDLNGVADDGYRDPLEGPAGDNVGADFENLTMTSESDDILTGNDSPNQIDGGPGDDQIMGLGGPDELIGGPGDDDLDGGNGVDGIEGQGGSDSIRSRDNAADEVGCGSATDTLLADSLDVFSVTCDQSSTGAELKSGNVKLSKKGKAKVKVACPVAEGIDCQVKITANKGKKTVAKGSGKVKTGKTGKITLKLTKKGKRQKGKKIKGQASTQLTDATGAKVTTSRKLVLKR